MEQLQHDPRSKSQIKDALYAFLYDPIQKQFKGRIDTLIVRNAILGGYTHRHFVYKGELYNSEITHPPVKKNRLLAQLRPDVDAYLKDLEALNDELPYVLGFINQVLNASNDLKDYLRLFPDSIHHPINHLIATCPCRTVQLSEEKIVQLKANNKESINLMKKRLVTNLLI